jgi:hypothetical protein
MYVQFTDQPAFEGEVSTVEHSGFGQEVQEVVLGDIE